MEGCCDLEVDVNGEEVFMVHKKILMSFSSLFSKLFGNLKGTALTARNLKVIFNEFPGGAKGFELMARFCYDNGRTMITPSNMFLLNCAAHFLEMDGNGSSRHSLIDQTEKSLKGINFWTWSELLEALKQCQDLLPATKSSVMLQCILDCLIGRIALPSIASLYTCSSDSSSFQFSCDTSIDSLKSSSSQLIWWFEDLLFLNVDLIEELIKTMVSLKVNHATIYKFLFYYHKSRCIGAATAEKRKITEVVISLLSLLDRSFLSCKGLFEIYRVALGLRISKFYKNNLESLMGSQLDQATIDYLLAPSPHRRAYFYDVNLVLRLVQAFLLEGGSFSFTSRLKKVTKLLDSYLVEVAPDSHLKPSKFTALVLLLPDYARASYDRVYRAMDLFLEVHAGLCEEEKRSVCCALNHEKLSEEALKDLSRNSKFPSQTVQMALITQQSMIKCSLPDTHHLLTFCDSLFCSNTMENLGKEDSETKKLRADLQGMHWKMMGLEKVCGTIQTEMANIMRSRLSILGNARSVPKLCS